MIRIRLVGCERYNYKGELYMKGKVYAVGESKAAIMLRDKDDYDRPYFVPYVKLVNEKSAKQKAAELAAELAKIAAEEDEGDPDVIERPDGSEPDKTDIDPDKVDQPVPVDTDDDPSLDDDDAENTEEVDVDRADGSEVEV